MTEAMGIWWYSGAFAVVERQSECVSKNLLNTSQQILNITFVIPPILNPLISFVDTFLIKLSPKDKNIFL